MALSAMAMSNGKNESRQPSPLHGPKARERPPPLLARRNGVVPLWSSTCCTSWRPTPNPNASLYLPFLPRDHAQGTSIGKSSRTTAPHLKMDQIKTMFEGKIVRTRRRCREELAAFH